MRSLPIAALLATLAPLLLLVLLVLLLPLAGCALDTPTRSPADPDTAPPTTSYDRERGLTLVTDAAEVIRARAISATEMLVSITAVDGGRYEVHYQPHQVVQRATSKGRSDELILIDDHGRGEAWLNGVPLARSDGPAARPKPIENYERSLITDNALAASMFAALDEADTLPLNLQRLIIDERGNCRDGFVSLLVTCVEATCFLPNPVCSGCTGALFSCVIIAIFNDWNGGHL